MTWMIGMIIISKMTWVTGITRVTRMTGMTEMTRMIRMRLLWKTRMTGDDVEDLDD